MMATTKEIAADMLSDENSPRCEPEIIRMSEVQRRTLEWLWPGRFPLGKLSFIVGDPDLGKSFIALDMAARISTGTPWPDTPDLPNPRGSIVLLSAEDDAEDTIGPRLDALGADSSRISLLKAVKVRDEAGVMATEPVSLDRDLKTLEEAIRRLGDCRLVIIDPISAYLGVQIDSHKNDHVRRILAPLKETAEQSRVAIVMVSHLNKSAGGPAMYRTTGSLAFTAAARASWAVGRDKENTGRRLIVRIKGNLGAPTPGLAYHMEPSEDVPDMVKLVWEPGFVTMTADEVLSCASAKRNARGEAQEFLKETLAGGRMPQEDIMDQAKGNGFSAATVRRAKESLKIVSERIGFGKVGVWYWSLPGIHEDAVPGAADEPIDAH